MTKIYTRGGDEGETGLLGGQRVTKTDPRVEAYGTVDELNAALGLALALTEVDASPRDGGDASSPQDPAPDPAALRDVQDDLFTIGARLAAAEPDRARSKGLVPDLPEGRVAELEGWIDRLDRELPELDAFVLPGGSPMGAQLHVARTVCRRAERAAVRLADSQPELRKRIIPYLNRLSDLLFTLARAVNHRAGAPEAEWTPRRRRRDPE